MQAGQVTFQFGRYTLDPAHRRLLAGDAPVSLSSRAFDILQMLVESRDRVLGKDELINRVWRGMAVEENNLAVQISALRRALSGPGEATLITTVPGQGYRFVGEVAERIVSPPAVAGPVLPQPQAQSPVPVAVTQGRRGWMLPASGVAALLLAAVVWLVMRPGLSAPEAAPRLSLVVLPFRNLSGDTKQDYLADAVSDDLTTDLSHIPGSTVIARASSDTYKGRAVAADVIGRALHVRYLLEGSIRGEDGMFRINAQLIDSSSGAHLWADRFDVAQGKISDAQTDIVRHIASALNVTLVAIEGARSLHERPDDPDALDLFFRARSIIDRAQTLEEYSAAQGLLEKAIALQPDFADALSNLGLLLVTKTTDFDDPHESADELQARQVISRALSVAPHGSDALVANGALNAADNHYEAAEASYDAAIAAAPNNVLGRAGKAVAAWQLGRPQVAISELHEDLLLDPLGPSVKKRYALLGMASFMMGNWQDSVDWLLRSLAGDGVSEASGGRSEWSHAFLIAAREKAGMKDEAKRDYDSFAKTWPNRTVWRLASYFSKAQASLPHFVDLKTAWKIAGMPEFSEDHAAAQPSLPSGQERDVGDFAPVPQSLFGASTVDASQVVSLLTRSPAPVVLDVGPGAAVIPGALWKRQDNLASAPVLDLIEPVRRNAELSGLIVMSAGSTGWAGYNTAAALAKARIGQIYWFRGGEEAWAASGRPAEDRRDP